MVDRAAQLPEHLLEEVAPRAMPEVVAEPGEHDRLTVLVLDTELRLPPGDALDEHVREVRDTERMLESRMRRALVDVVRRRELHDAPKALKLGGVDDRPAVVGQKELAVELVLGSVRAHEKVAEVYNGVRLQRTFIPSTVNERDRGEVRAPALACQLALGVGLVEEVAVAIANAVVVRERGHGRGARRPAGFNNAVAEPDKALVNTLVGRGVVAVRAGDGDAGVVQAALHARVHHRAVVELAAEGCALSNIFSGRKDLGDFSRWECVMVVKCC